MVYNDITDRRRKEAEVKQLMEDSKKKAEELSESARVLEDGLARIAKGDLSFVAPVAEGDPLIRLKQDYNSAVTAVKAVMEELGKSVKHWK